MWNKFFSWLKIFPIVFSQAWFIPITFLLALFMVRLRQIKQLKVSFAYLFLGFSLSLFIGLFLVYQDPTTPEYPFPRNPADYNLYSGDDFFVVLGVIILFLSGLALVAISVFLALWAIFEKTEEEVFNNYFLLRISSVFIVGCGLGLAFSMLFFTNDNCTEWEMFPLAFLIGMLSAAAILIILFTLIPIVFSLVFMLIEFIKFIFEL